MVRCSAFIQQKNPDNFNGGGLFQNNTAHLFFSHHKICLQISNYQLGFIQFFHRTISLIYFQCSGMLQCPISGYFNLFFIKTENFAGNHIFFFIDCCYPSFCPFQVTDRICYFFLQSGNVQRNFLSFKQKLCFSFAGGMYKYIFQHQRAFAFAADSYHPVFHNIDLIHVTDMKIINALGHLIIALLSQSFGTSVFIRFFFFIHEKYQVRCRYASFRIQQIQYLFVNVVPLGT